ncbi:(2Fe-2S) ferredoxin domain-containing protein [Nocardioides sp. CBS4Y-1]|uniref:(2Fe-2S) ferredoxin domain-containing protein n=2 Tax=Nocardioides acrostichi TaxID=2784339 RepID=A0A930V3H4_9ACTN|nr:(2Fe-2S) ferredoxin domain-containing protein [Nocardioides acrostichi]
MSDELSRLADAGAAGVALVGVDLGFPGVGTSWLRRVAAQWWRERSGHRPEVRVAATTLGRDTTTDAVGDAVAGALAGDVRTVTGREAPPTSTAWEQVPAYRHQVLVCRGPRCTARGAERNAEALTRALVEAGLDGDLGDDDVLVAHTGCLFPCNQAPVACVQPDDVWYGRLDPAAVRELVREHLLAGRPLAARRLPRARRALG